VRGTGSHPVAGGEFSGGGQVVSAAECPAGYGCPQVSRNAPVRGGSSANRLGARREDDLVKILEVHWERGHVVVEGSGRTLISLRDPRRVGEQGGRATSAVSQPSGNGADVDPGGDQLSSGVMRSSWMLRSHPSRAHIRAKRWLTDDGTSHVEWSGDAENSRPEGLTSTPRDAATSSQSRR